MSAENANGRMDRRAFIGRSLQVAGALAAIGSGIDGGYIWYRQNKIAHDGNPAAPLLIQQSEWVIDEHMEDLSDSITNWDDSPVPTMQIPLDEALSVRAYEARRKSEVDISHDPVSETLIKPGFPKAAKVFGLGDITVVLGTLLRRGVYKPSSDKQQTTSRLRSSSPELA